MARAHWLPIPEEYESYYSLVPDVVADDKAYVRTGLRDARGRMILRQITKPVGFTADHKARQYAVDAEDPDDEPSGAHPPELAPD